MQDPTDANPQASRRDPWNKGKLIGAKPPLRPKHVWSIRTKLQIAGRTRDLAMFNLAIDKAPRMRCRQLEGGGRCTSWSLGRSSNRAPEKDGPACQVRIDRTDPRGDRLLPRHRQEKTRRVPLRRPSRAGPTY